MYLSSDLHKQIVVYMNPINKCDTEGVPDHLSKKKTKPSFPKTGKVTWALQTI